MKLQEFFARLPVFTHAEFAAFVEAEKPRSAKTRDSLLAYYIRTGRILRVRRGLYIAVPAGVDAKACPVDPYLLAAKMTDDAALAYHTACVCSRVWTFDVPTETRGNRWDVWF